MPGQKQDHLTAELVTTVAEQIECVGRALCRPRHAASFDRLTHTQLKPGLDPFGSFLTEGGLSLELIPATQPENIAGIADWAKGSKYLGYIQSRGCQCPGAARTMVSRRDTESLPQLVHAVIRNNGMSISESPSPKVALCYGNASASTPVTRIERNSLPSWDSTSLQHSSGNNQV